MLVLLGIFAGALSTTVGMGGGQLLVIGLAALSGPREALVVTGPALLVGNLHRGWLYRESVDWARVGRFTAGAVPGALVGGLLASRVPTAWLSVAIACMATLAVGRLLLGGFRLPGWSLLPGGMLVGGVAATAGGAGILAGPLWKGAGIEGDAYIGSIATGAAVVHLARMVGYGAAGALGTGFWLDATVLAACIVLGNALGRRLRSHLSEGWRRRLEVGAIGGAAAVALSSW